MILKNLTREIMNKIPECAIKNQLKRKYFLYRTKALIDQLSKVPIVKSGCEIIKNHQMPFVVLKDGTVLYGQLPNQFEIELYSEYNALIASGITKKTIRVAIDVIYRYLFPHAMPNLVMPYSRKSRQYFHPQHTETINDLPNFSRKKKEELKAIYSPKPREIFLDIGSYMGYGAVRMSKELKAKGKIIAVEADPDSLRILKQNIHRNNLSNVTIVPKAIWNKKSQICFQKSDRQANSAVDGIIDFKSAITVETTTIDEILKDLGLTTIDIVSMTINGAEVEAVDGMRQTLKNSKHIRLSIAGWYKRGSERICDIISPILRKQGLEVAVGTKGGVLAWK